jgi:OOP family OmpA-OmpF porin
MWDECPDTRPGVEVNARGCEIQDMTRDTDRDRVPDYRDQCPNTALGAPVDAQGCSLDSDMDGVLTGDDRCPASRPGAQVDEFGCESDDDQDGVLNQRDSCPGTPRGARVDINGCELADIIRLPGVNFGSGSDLLLPGFENLLRDAAATLNKNPDLKVEVSGHTDDVGDANLNMGLSERRAKTVMDYLIRYGVDPSRITFRGYGESEPIANNTTVEGRARNRRVELRIITE